MIALVGAPTNLGLRPPQPGSVPGCAKAPEALREAGLHAAFVAAGALDSGVVVPGRYVDDVDASAEPRSRIRNQDAIIAYTLALADRIGALLDAGQAPLVLGGDCSIALAAGVALHRRGRFGLAHLDGHTDFRHPGNSAVCESVAGEDLAAVIGIHWPAVSDIDSAAPYFAATDVVQLGCRVDDEHLAEVRSRIAAVITAGDLHATPIPEAISVAVEVLTRPQLDGYWLHIDLDVLDPEYLPAVDSPAPGGLAPASFVELVASLAPGAIGAHVGIYDPDLDPDGRYARLLTSVLVPALGTLGTSARTST